MQTIHDTWLWAEQMDGDLVNMPGIDVTPDTDVEGWVQSLFERYEQATLIRLWQQHEGKDGPTNVCLKEWYRLPEFRRAEPPLFNPLGIFCADCGQYCHLNEIGKRWICKYGHE